MVYLLLEGMRGTAARQYAFFPSRIRDAWGTPSRTDRLEPFPCGAELFRPDRMLASREKEHPRFAGED